MRRYLTLIFLLCLTVPAGISFSGCVRNPAGNYCNGQGYGLKVTQVFSIDLEPRTTGISLAFGQTRQVTPPTAKTCHGASASVSQYLYGTTNNQLVDISPTGSICAGTWNRNTGGGIPDYTICSAPNPTPNTGGLPYNTAYITASADSITSNPVEVYVHVPVSSISLALTGTPQQAQCYSQSTVAQLDSEACYAGPNNAQYELCAPPGLSAYSCKNGLNLAGGVTSVPDCSTAIGPLAYTVGTASVATINPENNQITAELPGTTAITASVAGSGASAGYFSVCPPAKISIALANGATSGTVTQGVQQNVTTTVTDTTGHTITGLTLDYQSTNPLELTAGAGGAIGAQLPGSGSVYAICQPSSCNPAPINQVGVFGTGLSISSNPVNITIPGTASSYLWFSAPGASQYFVPVELLTGSVGSTVRLPYVPNSMIMDQLGTNLYFGSAHELMVYSTSTNTISKQDPSVPGVVLAVSPNNQTLVINDQVRQVFYLYTSTGTISTTFNGVGTAAQWTPDSKTLYVTDTSAANNAAAGITGHTDTLYVYNANTGWTTYALPAPPAQWVTNHTPREVAVTVPGLGAYLSGSPTVAHTWCPSGTVGNYLSMSFYPQVDSVTTQTDVLAATTDGQHILGAGLAGTAVSLSDISVKIPTEDMVPGGTSDLATPIPCPINGATLSPLAVTSTLNPPQSLNVTASAVNQIVTSPAAVTQGSGTSPFNLSFVTYNPTAGSNGLLPYYKVTTQNPAPGTVGTVTLTAPTNGTAPTAPVAGAFSPDNSLFFVSSAGDNQIHYINTTTLQDTQQISPNLPSCAPGSDPDCVFTNATAPASGIVPATVIAVKPRPTT
ncbi:MAG TPA: hypothetical protein VKR52_20330 [Terracidiphilus sp.]|nr:hypothetical protein [Terracidiphilus sp.]